MNSAKPLLENPAPHWKYDLPVPNDPPSRAPSAQTLTNPPNHVNDVYLELPRSSFKTRGFCVWAAIALFILAITSFFFQISIITNLRSFHSLAAFFFGLTASIVSFWGGVYYWRMDVEAPRDEPIRFNRLRRKVYVYRFHQDGLRPFSRVAWGVRTEVYNWEDLRAEVSSVYGPMGTGGLIETVSLAVVEPGTNKVIDRFHFAHESDEGEMYWAMAQLFMQQGPQALPHFPRPPRDWSNESVTFNLARRLAPKVKWPEDMDLESRSAP
ncbi:hypothetical protein LOY34_10885 [Pseudomonas sp. B21-009]|uniref:DUF6708 domain-containing protein n=1 Tax=Pseudomonas sp. B21-009 TaxID=2895470 RepID=UPI00215FA14B|nr:DUF6708 domain-containing protein [Pseudomonas sp. B21-009]UVM69000.1 hypothetical protein LOY34_10885 [Pseudomonas sp. B21-009]